VSLIRRILGGRAPGRDQVPQQATAAAGSPEPRSGMPRLWPTIWIPGITPSDATYSMLDLDGMPGAPATARGSLDWLEREPPREEASLRRGPDDEPAIDADAAGLAAVAAGLSLPPEFEAFIADPGPRQRVRSATACYLDLAQFPVTMGDGSLVHFLSDQQWVLHWLLWSRPDGSAAVVATPEPLGFDTGEGEPVRALDPAAPAVPLAVCADSFGEFLWRYWAMNELFFRLAQDGQAVTELPAELRGFAEAYPRRPASASLW
jgi:hypothetical protein